MKEVSNRLSFSQMEEEILQFWRLENIFQKSIDEDRKIILSASTTDLLSPPGFRIMVTCWQELLKT